MYRYLRETICAQIDKVKFLAQNCTVSAQKRSNLLENGQFGSKNCYGSKMAILGYQKVKFEYILNKNGAFGVSVTIFGKNYRFGLKWPIGSKHDQFWFLTKITDSNSLLKWSFSVKMANFWFLHKWKKLGWKILTEKKNKKSGRGVNALFMAVNAS